MKTPLAPCSILCILAACAAPQSRRSEEAPAPLYTTSAGAPEGQHVMPDGTNMHGHAHAEHGGATHVMPDGAVMQGAHHGEGATHVMPDGAVMPGAHHGAGATHVMPDGGVMPGHTHGAHQH